MKYTYKIGRFKGPVTLHLTEDALHVLNEAGEIKREIELSTIQKVQSLKWLKATDPNGESFEVTFTKIVTLDGPSVAVRNGLFVGGNGKYSEVVVDQSVECRVFLAEVSRRVALANPQAKAVDGSWGASAAWWCVALIGAGMIALGIAVYFTDPFWTAFGLSLFCFPIGLGAAVAGVALGRGFWPRTAPLSGES